jgi:hypothetical protein
MTRPIFRTYSLVPRGGPGLACDEDGLALGPVTLAKSVPDVDGGRRYRLLAFESVVRALHLAYEPVSDTFIERRCRGLARVAQLLGTGEAAFARIYAVLLGFPEIPPEGMAKLADATSLRKYNPNWENEARIPAGSSDGANGRVTATVIRRPATPRIQRRLRIAIDTKSAPNDAFRYYCARSLTAGATSTSTLTGGA